MVDGAQTLQGTTWGSWHVTGTFDGAVFTLTERPGPVQPHGKGQDRSGGVAAPGRAGIDSRLPAVQEDLASSEVRETLGAVQYSYTDRAGERLLVGLWLADKAAHRFAEERWGDLVELRSLLEPVE